MEEAQQQQQMVAMIQEMQRNQLVHLKLIGYLETDLEAKNNRLVQLQEELEAKSNHGSLLEEQMVERNGSEPEVVTDEP